MGQKLYKHFRWNHFFPRLPNFLFIWPSQELATLCCTDEWAGICKMVARHKNLKPFGGACQLRCQNCKCAKPDLQSPKAECDICNKIMGYTNQACSCLLRSQWLEYEYIYCTLNSYNVAKEEHSKSSITVWILNTIKNNLNIL
jgi:hypothetical protein